MKKNEIFVGQLVRIKGGVSPNSWRIVDLPVDVSTVQNIRSLWGVTIRNQENGRVREGVLISRIEQAEVNQCNPSE